jgi:PD-(D/E)XK endonuclease
MEHPKDIGDRTQLAVMLALRDAGYAVLVPFGENTRYDLVIDNDEELARVQCKTGRLRQGAIRFATCSCYGHHANPKTARRPYGDEIDYFAVYCPETEGVYLVPIADVPVKVLAALRVTPARNSQQQRIREARNYQLATVRCRATAGPRATSGA